MTRGQRRRLKSLTLPRPATLVASALALLALAVASASGEIVQTGNLIIRFQSIIAPAKLPEKKLAPISLTFATSIKTSDRSHVPVLKTISLEFNKHGVVNTKGVPTCSPSRLLNTVTSQALKVCGKALIGRGHAEAEIALPEQAPFIGSGPLLIFNGQPKGGHPVLVFHVYAHVPAPTTFVTTGVISHERGTFGTKIRIRIPTIVGGHGSLTFAEGTVHKIIRGNCPAPSALSGAIFTFARAHYEFADQRETTVTGLLVRHCEVKR